MSAELPDRLEPDERAVITGVVATFPPLSPSVVASLSALLRGA